MNFGIKLRLVALSSAVGLMGALIVLVTLASQRQAAELHSRLSQLRTQSLGIAEKFRYELRQVDDKMLEYQMTREEADWQAFLVANHQLDLWINDQKSKLTTQRERTTLRQIGVAYHQYLRAAENLHTRFQTSNPQTVIPFSVADALVQSRRRLFDLGQALVEAHLGLRKQLLTHADHRLMELRVSVMGLLALLFLFGIALAVMIYRDMIHPLRVKLVESQAVAEHHEKLASLGLLAAGVAHEIRNPLTAIKAALFIQKKKFPAASEECGNVETVEREILRLERIVNNFLQFARPAEPEITTIAADSLLHEAQRFFAPQLEMNRIRLNVEPCHPMNIRADSAQIKQVLINLIQNAADSIGQDGQITLRARPDRKRLTNGETAVVILEVADSGKGISPEVEKRLFDPFFTTKENGTGLGLSIAARIVQQHGGQLQYQTQVNRGAIFGIILPQVIE